MVPTNGWHHWDESGPMHGEPYMSKWFPLVAERSPYYSLKDSIHLLKMFLYAVDP